MPLKSIFIKNFRGVSDGIDLPIRPITLFIGANSSGKSTVIHSLATLSQTVKLPNDSRPLILDDEFGSVHLGRFIEVIHSKSYQDCISLGLTLGHEAIAQVGVDGIKPVDGEIDMRLDFKSTTRTQKVHVDSGTLKIGNETCQFKMKRDKSTKGKPVVPEYDVNWMGKACVAQMTNGFALEETSFFTAQVDDLKAWIAVIMAQKSINQQLERTYYLGPFRQPPVRQYPTRGASPIEVGAQGEATATLLANEVMRSHNRTHINEISKWLNIMGIGKRLNISRIAASDMFGVEVSLPDEKTFALADLGYGVSQALPVLTQCSFAADGSILLFEQPELHLHSLAIRPLATVFIDAMRKKKLTILAETHAIELVGEFQRQLRAGTIKLEEIIVYRVTRQDGHTVIKPIEIEKDDFDIYELWKKGISED